MKKTPKDDHTRRENSATQPLRMNRIFNNPALITEAWYPICPSRELKKGVVRSFTITRQRLAVFRGQDGKVRALDAFCPHMGADLGNGRVCDNQLECYFHQWRFNSLGELTRTRGVSKPPVHIKTMSYPTCELYGCIWVFAGPVATHAVPKPFGFDEHELVAWQLKGRRLYAHHHVMMVGGIDLLHFASVHGIDGQFKYSIREHSAAVADWHIEGALPATGGRSRLARFVLGPSFRYVARFAGGSIAALSYGVQQRWQGTGSRLPTLAVLWGCVADEAGISTVDLFFITRKRPGIWGWIHSRLLLLGTILLLIVLKDDDIKAFPHMRFQAQYPVAEDQCVVRFIRWIDRLRPSLWSFRSPDSRSPLQKVKADESP